MSLPDLKPEDFADFFAAVHSYEPFLWQKRMAAEVLGNRHWPEAVSLPTSAGKTSLIDIAVFAVASEAHLDPRERRMPLRIFFIIDRRVVADEAHDRAKKISGALLEASIGVRSEPALVAIAKRLRSLSGHDSRPLHHALMRGGIALDDGWIRSPSQPTVCVSTVDQVGSRLLFRGYGVPPRQRSIHAALIAHDSLLIVDEAHISTPFCETLHSVRRLTGRGTEAVIRPLQIVEMTATPKEGIDPFALLPAEAAEPEMERRIAKAKPTRLDTVADNPDEQSQPALVRRIVEQAHEWADRRPRIIGIVVNRVLTARRVFAALDEARGKKALFIGRIRPLDRDRLWEKWRHHLTSDPKMREASSGTVFIVATQTIEVGADLDFDALISELAPLDALRQRFGRLNRRGRDIEVEALVLATKEQLAARYNDPVYGDTLAPTWKWLQAQQDGKGRSKTVNFAYTNLKARLDAADLKTRESMRATSPATPLLHSSFVDAWACTAAPLMHDPDVAPFLHGVQAPQREVQIVWRADLDEDLFKPGAHRDEDYAERLNAVQNLLAVVPPSSRESLPVPVHTAARWLQNFASLDLADTANSADREPERNRLLTRHVLVWRDAANIEMAWRIDQISPGDVLVVPSTYGGADEFGWVGFTTKTAAVLDLAEEAAWKGRRAPFLRLHPAVLAQHGLSVSREFSEVLNDDSTAANRRELVTRLLTESPTPTGDLQWGKWAEAFAQLPLADIQLLPVDRYRGRILRSRRAIDPLTLLFADDGHDEASQTASSESCVPLRDHLANVAARASALATRAGMSEAIVDAMKRAGVLHDIGKADPRIQVLFHGSEAAGYAAVKVGNLLAKSTHRFASGAAYKQLYRLAGLPLGARHETLSVALAEREPDQLPKNRMRELALHLIAAHHGFARPFLKPMESEDEQPDNVDLRSLGLSYSGLATYDSSAFSSGVADRFQTLQQQYGWWGLAWLETILRLADWAQSAAEQENRRFPASK
jgi:CRISPR-associated endonuclease/helicase Cas3